ncbi:MAG TPA: ABC transporter permease [Chitinophagaceae bacterium]|nr:ABC transporter permease [Chitinophagaceae bacterium]
MQHLNQLYALSKRNIIVRYKHSLIGFFWGFFKPLLYLLIFIVIFSSQFSSISNQVLYITSGILFWFFFSNCTSQGAQSIVQSAGLIKSIYIPTIFFPLAEVIGELFNILLALMVYFIIMNWFGMIYSLTLFWVIPILFLFALFSFSITLILSALNVFYRDIGILWNTIQPALFYLTPIAYTESLIPQKFSFVIKANPIYYFIKLFRYPLYESKVPDFFLFGKCILITIVSCSVAIFLFNKMKNQFITAI